MKTGMRNGAMIKKGTMIRKGAMLGNGVMIHEEHEKMIHEKQTNGKNHKKQRITNALILQGGGALGAYELGVVERLYEDPKFSPAVISGVSIGAVNATVLAGTHEGEQVKALHKLWEHITAPRGPLPPSPVETFFERMIPFFGIHDFYRPRTDYYQVANWTNMYEIDPLREMLEELVDFPWLNYDRKAPLLILSATNVSTGNIVNFSNKKYDQPSGKYIPAGDQGITANHVLASGAIPPGFPMVENQGEYYWDGGLFSNTPLAPVVEAVGRIAPDDDDRRRIFLVNVYSNVGRVPENMPEVFNRMHEIQFSNKIVFDVNMMNRTNQYVAMMTIFDKVLTRMDDKKMANEIRNLECFKWMMSYNCIGDIVLIQNNRPESAMPGADFSAATIQRRISAGHDDASIILEELAEQAAGEVQQTQLNAVLESLKAIKLSASSETMRRQHKRPSLTSRNGHNCGIIYHCGIIHHK